MENKIEIKEQKENKAFAMLQRDANKTQNRIIEKRTGVKLDAINKQLGEMKR